MEKAKENSFLLGRFFGDAVGTGEPLCGGCAHVRAGTNVLVKGISMEKQTRTGNSDSLA